MHKSFFIGFCASLLIISPSMGQGLLGERFVEFSAGYERLKISHPGFSATIDGWGAGAGLNIPVIQDSGRFGLDFAPSLNHLRGDDSGVKMNFTELESFFRGRLHVGEMDAEPRIKPLETRKLTHDWILPCRDGTTATFS